LKFFGERFRPKVSTSSSSSRLISAIWVLENFIPGVPSLNYLRESAPLSGNLALRQSRISTHCSVSGGAGEPSVGVTPASLAVSAYTNFELLLAHGPVGDRP
jgi:hypothetical protein